MKLAGIGPALPRIRRQLNSLCFHTLYKKDTETKEIINYSPLLS
jgi:hypothetical protein